MGQATELPKSHSVGTTDATAKERLRCRFFGVSYAGGEYAMGLGMGPLGYIVAISTVSRAMWPSEVVGGAGLKPVASKG